MSAVAMIIASGAGDRTPDALNWANVGPGSAPQNNGARTIAGVNAPITLRAAISSFSSTGGGARTLQIYRNGVSVASVTAAAAAFVEASFSAGDTCYFLASQTTPGSGNNWSGTVTVTNQSDAAAVLDTFPVTVDAGL